VSVKEELHSLIELLDEDAAAEALDYVRWLTTDAEPVSAEDLAAIRRGQEQIGRGEYVTLEELRQELGG
jgi:hypothetical protein